jgi:hypothetical protein
VVGCSQPANKEQIAISKEQLTKNNEQLADSKVIGLPFLFSLFSLLIVTCSLFISFLLAICYKKFLNRKVEEF